MIVGWIRRPVLFYQNESISQSFPAQFRCNSGTLMAQFRLDDGKNPAHFPPYAVQTHSRLAALADSAMIRSSSSVRISFLYIRKSPLTISDSTRAPSPQ